MAQHFGFARGQAVFDHVRGDAGRQRRGNAGTATAMHGADGVDQLVAQHVLEQVAAGAGLQGAHRTHVATVGGEHDDACARVVAADPGDGLHAVHAWQLQVHQHHVRAQGHVLGDRFLAIGRFAQQPHVGLHAKQCGQAVAQQGVVINNEHADGDGRQGHAGSPVKRFQRQRRGERR